MIQAEQLLSDLTEAQREAVTTVDGPVLIIAGAGSGKTRVLTRRVAYLMGLGIPASSVLAITFTNKAAGEMKSRVEQLLGRPLRDFGKLDQPWPLICTFHSLCLRILRHYAEVLKLPGNFSVYDAADQTRLIKEALKALEISSTNFSPAAVHGAISNAKNRLQTPQEFASLAGDFYSKTAAKVYTKYQELLAKNAALDFDDLLMRTAHALREHPRMLKELQERFQYVLIDEYQDTNHAQYIIAHALALRHRNLCVVGDPDQSIYGWRGADIQNILDFEDDYPDAKVVRLEQNYRSTRTILAIASQLIAHNVQRKEKALWTENSQGEKARLLLCQDERDEAEQVMRQLRVLNEEGMPWSQMAVFYRMNALSRVMEDALRRAGVPYQIARGVEFYNRKEIKDVLAYLRVIANPADEVSLTRIINVPTRGIGDSSVKQMQVYATAHGLMLQQAMEQASEISGISSRAVNAIQRFGSMLSRWRKLVDDRSSVQRIMEQVVRDSGMQALLEKEEKAGAKIGEGPLANVNELISSAAEYDRDNPEGALHDYLAQVSLVSDADHMKGAGGAVTLMTLHAAKGLEFDVVAMIGMEEGILPHARARDSLNELEEERRLCFVGITRARQRLIMSRANYRTIRGMRDRTIGSPFLSQMPGDQIEALDNTGVSRDFGDDWRDESQEVPEESPADRFREGQLVRHPQFGLGRIAELSGVGRHTRAVISFNSAGRKTLILEIAPLEVVQR